MSKKATKAKANHKIEVTVATQIEELSNARKAWENGAFKKSNEELYQLLERCLQFYLQTRGDKKKCKALNALLKYKNVKYNEGTSLQTRIVRLVFGAHCGKRAYAYARVITVAADEKSPKKSMYDFIESRGGIEEIRRTKKDGKSPAVVRQDSIQFAVNTLEKSDALTKPFKVKDARRKQPEDATHNLFVAIMRQESDGTYSLVYETSAKSVVNSALAQAGKEQSANAQAEQQVQNERDAASKTADQLENAISEGELSEAA